MVLGPVQAFTGPQTKLGWTNLYTSDSVNKAFIGVPTGIYLGFTPSITGQVLTLKPDTAIMFKDLIGSMTVGDTLVGNSSGGTAVIRYVNDSLEDKGFVTVDSVAGGFSPGETISGPGFTAELVSYTDDAISVAKLITTSRLSRGQTEEALTVIIGDEVNLDYSPTTITDGTYYVKLVASYEIGTNSSAEIISIKDAPPDHRFALGICKVTKSGVSLILEPFDTTNRSDPYADAVTRNGFMPGDSIADLAQALTTTNEVFASRFCYGGVDHGLFDPANPQTTGLPGRLNSDLERANMAARLGKRLISVQGNDYDLPTIPSGNTINVSSSFGGKSRSVGPFIDPSNGELPSILTVPDYIKPDGFSGITLTVTDATGSFTPGAKIAGQTAGGSAIIQSIDGDNINVDNIGRSFFVGETVTSGTSSATISSIDIRDGAVTTDETGFFGFPGLNTVVIRDTLSGKYPVDVDGNPIYGRLLFGPSGSSGSGGGDPGELLVAENTGEQLNYTSGSTVITGNNIDFTEYFEPGDLVEGADGRFYAISSDASAVQTTTLFLQTSGPYVGPNASAGSGVGPGPRRRIRYTLKLVSKSGGIESDATITTDSIPAGAGLRIFFPVWLDRARSNYTASLSLRQGGESYDLQGPSSTIPCIGYNAAAGPTTPIIGALKQFQIGAGNIGSGNYHTINYALSGDAPPPTLAQSAPGVIDINAVGPIGDKGGDGPTLPGPQGPQGSGFLNIFSTLPVITVIGTGPGATGTETFDFSPKRVRFYTIAYNQRLSATQYTAHYITALTVDNYDVGTEVSFSWRQTGFGQEMTYYCAAATN